MGIRVLVVDDHAVVREGLASAGAGLNLILCESIRFKPAPARARDVLGTQEESGDCVPRGPYSVR